MRSSVAFAGLAALYRVLGVVAQVGGGVSNATCLPTGFEWTFNHLGQSPCQLAASAGGACLVGTGKVLSIQPLGDNIDVTYGGIPADYLTPCACSTVFGSFIAACAYCQGHAVPNNTANSGSCAPNGYSVESGSFPTSIPSDTAFPAYAYQVIKDDKFNVTLAQSVAAQHLPDNTVSGGYVGTNTSPEPPASSSGSSSSPTSPPSSSSTPTSSGSTSASPGTVTVNTTMTVSAQPHSKSHTGAIVGGAVGGGCAVLIALVAGVYFLHRRNRRNANAGGRDSASMTPPEAGTPPYKPEAYSYSGSPSAMLSGTPELKPYDPNDPSTFPPSVPQTFTQAPSAILGMPVAHTPAPSQGPDHDARPAILVY